MVQQYYQTSRGGVLTSSVPVGSSGVPSAQTVGGGTSPAGFYKVPTGSVGPTGEPIYDVFQGTTHITDASQVPGQIENLPTLQAPAGFVSQFKPATSNEPTIPIKEPSLVNIPENLPDEFKSVLQGITKALEGLITAGKTINTQVDITPEKVASFLTQAQTELSPYYTQEQNLAVQDITRELGDLSGELERGREDILRNEKLAQEQISESAAERGVAFSTQRQRAERLQREQSQRSLQDIQRRAESSAGTIGRAGEKFLGTEQFKGISIPQFKPLSFGEVSMPQRPSFMPSATPLTGELERNRLVAERARLAELKKTERERMGLSFG